MDNRSLSRELSLISLGLVNEEISKQAFELTSLSLDKVLESQQLILWLIFVERSLISVKVY